MPKTLQFTRQNNWNVDATASDWYSDSLDVAVQPGELYQVSVSFSAQARKANHKTPGFYWSVRGEGPVTPVKSVSGEPGSVDQVFMSSGSIWTGNSTVALFEPNGAGPASFRVRVKEGDLSGKGVLFGFSMVLQVLT